MQLSVAFAALQYQHNTIITTAAVYTVVLRFLSFLLARDALVRMNRRAIAMTFVCLSVSVGRACIVIIQCTLARFKFVSRYYNVLGTLTPSSSRLFFSSTWKRGRLWMCKLGVISQERLKIEVKLLYWMLIGSHRPICRIDWHNNGWH